MKKAVICILQSKSGRTLFVKRSAEKTFMPGVWALPSGMVEDGEAPEDTVHREIQEELGLKVNKVNLLERLKEEEEGRGQIEKYIYLVNLSDHLEEVRLKLTEADGVIFMTFEDFYGTFGDDRIGHILVYLRDRYSEHDLI